MYITESVDTQLVQDVCVWTSENNFVQLVLSCRLYVGSVGQTLVGWIGW